MSPAIIGILRLTVLTLPCLVVFPHMCVADEQASNSGSPDHCKINTPDATVVEPGHVEFEANYTHTQTKKLWDNDSNLLSRGFSREHAAGFTLTAGLIDNLDINIGSNYSWLKDKDNDYTDADAVWGPGTGSGFGDLNFGARYRFLYDEQKHIELAYIGGFTAPTGSNPSLDEIGTSQEYWSYKQTLVGSKDWGLWTTNAAIGYLLPFGDKRGDARGTFNADLAAGYQVVDWIQPILELNYAYDFMSDDDDANLLAITAGLVMPCRERLAINVGVQQGVWGQNTDRATTYFIAFKTAY